MPGMTFTLSRHPFGNVGMHIYLTAGLFIIVAITLMILVYVTAEPSSKDSSGTSHPKKLVEVPLEIQSRIRFISKTFGILWIIDGVLQLRDAMPSQFVASIIRPAFALAPPLLGSISHVAETLWRLDPVKADIGTSYVQLTIGVGLLLLKQGQPWRIIVWLSIAWSLTIFALGNGFGIFYTGANLATGAPSAILIYLFASIELLKLGNCYKLTASTKRIGRFLGTYFLLGTLLSALPTEGFWTSNAYYQMIVGMARTKQPLIITGLLNAGASLVKNNGPYVNVFLVVSGATVAMMLYLIPGRRATGVAVASISALMWIFIQDFGVFSPTGTDFNAGLPIILMAISLSVGSKEIDGNLALEPELKGFSSQKATKTSLTAL